MLKLTPHDVTEDALLLIETLLEADPSTFDTEAEFTRLTSYTCPECKSTSTSQPDEEGLVDCLNCGIWFNYKTEANGVSAIRYRDSSDFMDKRYESTLPPPLRESLT